jgi:hypothetical protein
MHNLSYTCHPDTQIERQPVHADAERLHEIFAQNFARVNGLESFGLGHTFS